MQHINRIFPQENERRINELRSFRELLQAYHKQLRYSPALGEAIENDKSRASREQINKKLDHVHRIVIAAGVNPTVSFRTLVAKGSMDVILNALTLRDFGLDQSAPFDFIDRAIGKYEHNERAARIRMFNPFFYIGVALEFVASLPFRFLARMGFSRARAEDSLIGRITKALLELVAGAAAVIAILQAFGTWPLW